MFYKLIILLSLITNWGFAISCSDMENVKKYNGKYYTVTKYRMTFNQAKNAAEAAGGKLAVPKNNSENNFIDGMIKDGTYAWIGVHDSSFSSNYCFSVGCRQTPNRFKDIDGNNLNFSNWQSTQPDNLVKEYDTVDGEAMVSPLGEHWVAMFSPGGEWSDFGNHAADNHNPVKHYAVFEFNTIPECYEEPSTVRDSFTTKKCQTQLYDNETGNLQDGQSFDCQQDKYGTDFCPSALSQCTQQWDYEDGYSVEGVGSVVDYADKEKRYKCQYNGELLARKDYDACGYCRDKMRHDIKCYTDGSVLVDVYTVLKSNNSRYHNIISKKFFNQEIEKSTSRLYMGNAGINCNFPFYYWRTCDGTDCKHYFELSGSTCNGNDYRVSKTAPIPYTYSCPPGYTETNDPQGECKRTVEYTYYEYMCSDDENSQNYNYVPVEGGGDCNKEDPDTTASNQSSLDDSCNSSTPPANNCKREKFTCVANEDRPCAWVDEQWQCSPFPCFGESDFNELGTPVGSNDANNDGWSKDGNCNGQIYIFNGEDNRCRSEDAFFGLTGGGCCDKDDVFLGLVDCKEDEKMLARKRDDDLCRRIGNYCSKDLDLGFTTVCIQKKDTHCCFSSVLSRLINEEGRPQIGKDWGSPEDPKCKGFTPEEFQKLDFSKIEFDEFLEDISPDLENDISGSVESIESTGENIQNYYQ